MKRPGVVGMAAFAVAGAVIVFVSCSGNERPAQLSGRARSHAVVTHDPVIVVTGDIACTGGDSGAGAQQCAERDRTVGGVFHPGTGSLANSINPDYVILVGDLQYPNGSTQDFTNSPATAFGAFTPWWWGQPNLARKFFPVPGNHEYRTLAAGGFFARFGSAGNTSTPPGDPSQGYYAYDIPTLNGAWRAIALNSGPCTELSTDANGNPVAWDGTDTLAARQYRTAAKCDGASPQQAWLTAELQNNHRFCTLAYWHHNAMSGLGGVEGIVVPWWRQLANSTNQADVVLWGHQHDWERFAPQRCTSTGCTPDPAGARAFIAGLGGIGNTSNSCGGSSGVACTGQTEFRFGPGANLDKFGVLKLTLHDTTYDWAYIASDGSVLDSGTGACHDPAPAGGGTITGQVTNVQSGGAISGATVSWSGGTATSDAAGNYTLANVTPGSVTITGSAAGYLARNYTVTVTAGQTSTQAVQLSTSGKIVGNVTGNGVALSGATVAISGGQIAVNQSVQTDATGHYDEGWVPIGSYTVTCSASGFSTQSQPATVSTGATTTINCALTTAATGTISGVVTNLANGQALSGATITAGGASTTSAADGSYTLANLPAGSTTLTGTATGYLARSYTVTVTGGATTTQNVQLSTSGKIVGNVTGSGSALTGASVSISGGQIATNQTVQTDATGHYDEGWVPIGSYT
ncbi:MAG TPA: carboxypeptidase regulatory-like domain-containing protein, partial [Myxococcales bacterium]